jgi:putative phosphoribosyl transferase
VWWSALHGGRQEDRDVAGSARELGVARSDVDATIACERAELARRRELFRNDRPATDVRGRTVIVVDDGLATGLSDLVAVHALRGRGARNIVVAAPVGSHAAIALVRTVADDVICHTVPRQFSAVGRWYHDFDQVTDAEVRAIFAGCATRER